MGSDSVKSSVSPDKGEKFLALESCATDPSLIQAIDDWVNFGLPHFEELLSKLFAFEVIQDEMTHTLLFNVCGGYMHHFGNAYQDTQNLEESHHHAFMSLTKDERIAHIAQGLMNNMVLSGVERVVN